MKFTAEQLHENYEEFLGNIEGYITGDRKQLLLDFYFKYEERIILMPAAHKKEYHSAFPGGYVDHVNRVVRCAIKQSKLWATQISEELTLEELVFSAINHDLGKMGSDTEEAYIPQTDKWRRDKLGEDYMFNKSLPFSAVPDRSLFLLQQHDIKYTFNEMIAIMTHDGLYDEGNAAYLKTWDKDRKLRNIITFYPPSGRYDGCSY